jgi:hypothetical protein
MAKRNNKQQSDRVKTASFVNSMGITVHLQGIPPLIIPRISDSVTFPEKPTYQIETASGDFETHTHDKTTISTDEEKKAWAEYLEQNSEAEQTLASRILKAVLIEGVVVKDYSDFENWKVRQELMGLEVSDNKERMLLHYKETQLARTEEDIESVMNLVMELTGVDPKELDLAKSSFQDTMESEA